MRFLSSTLLLTILLSFITSCLYRAPTDDDVGTSPSATTKSKTKEDSIELDKMRINKTFTT
ncbi:MAG: hypothetical protein K0S74_1500 [Chlamydiales bacterium]|jgi:hypothetical protein|nr:hypothetical protein [Chlamydiales bacterium]